MKHIIEFVETGLLQIPHFSKAWGERTLPQCPSANISPRQRKQVFERDGYACRYCGSGEDLCADHVIPRVRGGKATADNLQTLCRSCNSIKRDKPAWQRKSND